MAVSINETSREMARCLLNLISIITENMQRVEVTDEFDPIGKLGQGSYGEVLLAKHKESGKTVALKLLVKNRTMEEDFLVEFATSLLLTSHPHIIDTYAVAFDTFSHFVFVQEVVPAGTLLSIIHPKVGVKENIVKRCVLQIASALDYMHSKALVHRDVKADNILLMDRDCHCIKLADFGLTRIQGTNIPSMSWVVPYMAPELCILEPNGQLLLHSSLDVWAFGMLVYIALTGRVPWNGAVASDEQYRAYVWWQGKNNIRMAPAEWQSFTPAAQHILGRMLAIDPTERCSVMDIIMYVNLPWKVQPEDLAEAKSDISRTNATYSR
ncbi:serine/threonine-protein kinase SBK1-like [Discoglossus pictus]